MPAAKTAKSADAAASAGGDDVVMQLKIANRLLAAQLRRRGDEPLTQQDIVKLLAGTGATTQQIADVLDTSTNTVRKAQIRLRGVGR